ncbi:bacillithiol system redox-active protein YtxJ [Cellulophaga baltica]|uniref:bacillithiol system redox-active protein YtxJ n=1 Tax=Cellulophaga TaxID=104264 RepID=UPI001C07EBCE|nr:MULTISPECIES: bacillithiol system redox-active protein YtxJ [Cellulophaga]MBU2996057.1 bacillithiol system redox-active protein YtxJ [Cellulophaga baltica]MDO6767452.1 bacillithiol system redox-active protein YtxJ [Cellulophaga sp. 1_MG-2023]
MGLFNNLFGNNNNTDKKEVKGLPWIPLTSVDQLDEIASKSNDKLQLIFKDSTTCGISRMVKNTLKSSYNLSTEEADLYYLDLLSYREVSNETGVKFQVIHQSPQLLVIKGGEAVANASHGGITEVDLKSFI